MKSKRVSLADIAESLSISKSTVSFVLNGKGEQFNISQKTQQLILDKAKELNYVPNFFAKGLREGKTQTIGFVIPDISNPFYAELTKSVQEFIYPLGYSLFIVSTNDDAKVETSLMRDLILRSVDAMIIAPCNTIPALRPILEETPIPVVWVDRIGDEFADFVGVDNKKEASELIHLFSTKPKSIALVCPQQSEVMTIQLRKEGLIEAAKSLNIETHILEITDDFSANQKAFSLLKDKKVDSFIALNNKIALNTFMFLKENGWQIGEDAKLLSFEDNEAFPYLNPPLSALRQPIKEIGIKTAERILERLKESTEDRKHYNLKCTFIARSSH